MHSIESIEWDCYDSAEIAFKDYFKNSVPGMFLEFGVFSGRSIRNIAETNPGTTVYGFDGFTGLPEDWGSLFPKGEFACEIPADLPKNVELVVGLFNDTLPGFLDAHQGDVSFVHIDCDLYSSAKYVLEQLAGRFVDGTILAFDEIIGLPDCLDHEARAFAEFLNEYGFSYECVGHFGSNQAGFRIFRA